MIEYLTVTDVQALPVFPLASAYPMISDEERADLADSIAANGVREPLVLFNGQLLDGRNRLAAAAYGRIEVVPVCYFEGTDEDADDFVIDLNEKRRHLSAGQRALVADAHRDIVEARARARMLGGVKVDPVQEVAQGSDVGKTREILARKHSVNHLYIDAAANLRKAAELTMTDTDVEGGVRATPQAELAQRLLRQVQAGNMAMSAAITEFGGKSAGVGATTGDKAKPLNPAESFEKKIDRAVSNLSDAIADHAPYFQADDLRYVVQQLEGLIRQAERTFA